MARTVLASRVGPARRGGADLGPVALCLQFLAPALMLAAAVLALLTGRRARAHAAALLVLGLMLVESVHGSVLSYGVALMAYVVVAIIAFVHRRSRPAPRVRAVVVALAGIACVAAGWLPMRSWGTHRYDGDPFVAPLASLVTWADGLHGQPRVAVAGFYEQYPLFGSDLENRVGIPSVSSRRGVPRAAVTCGQWRTALRAGAYDYVVILAQNPPAVVPQLAWTEGDPAARAIVVEGTSAKVFAFDHRVPATPCADTREAS